MKNLREEIRQAAGVKGVAATAFKRGAMFALSRQWRLAKYETPQRDLDVVLAVETRAGSINFLMGFHDGKGYYGVNTGRGMKPLYWMELPDLPVENTGLNTETEKK